MRIRENQRHDDKIELQMAPMIDVVFQLLVFFIMTFKVVKQEGDFYMKLPPPGNNPNSQPLDFDTPITVRILADANGGVKEIIHNQPTKDVRLGTDFDNLTATMVKYLGRGAEQKGGKLPSLIFNVDDHLKYGNGIAALTAVTAYTNKDGEQIKLLTDVKFKKPDN